MDHFVDEVRIQVEGGFGGHGCVAFRREKYIPFGGPSGGDGGDGGNVYIQADKSVQTLTRFKESFYYKAKKGVNGSGKGLYGKKGEDLVVRAPIGTVVYEEVSGQILADLTEDQQIFCLAQGGRGGHGNIHFKTSTNKAPQIAEKGTPGQVKRLRLELKILAEVGLIGFPNAGKSTLISNVSNSSSTVAAYPFSTLRPFLGVVTCGEWDSFIMADIPGIIEGSSEGKGRGLKFLRHIERSKVYLFVIDLFTENPAVIFRTLRKEMERYNPSLLDRPFIVALNKIDGFLDEDWKKFYESFLQETKLTTQDVFCVSTMKKINLDTLIRRVFELVKTTEYQAPLHNDSKQDLLENNWNPTYNETIHPEITAQEEDHDIEFFWETPEGDAISEKRYNR